MSFDIFDTLLLRPFFLPSDIFCLMNGRFNEIVNSTAFIDFHKIRINVEAELRRSLPMATEEVTLQNIYDRIGEIFGLSPEQQKELYDLETELELRFISPRQSGKELYELAKAVINDKDVRFCPHGRPVMIEISKYELEKQFGRV